MTKLPKSHGTTSGKYLGAPLVGLVATLDVIALGSWGLANGKFGVSTTHMVSLFGFEISLDGWVLWGRPSLMSLLSPIVMETLRVLGISQTIRYHWRMTCVGFIMVHLVHLMLQLLVALGVHPSTFFLGEFLIPLHHLLLHWALGLHMGIISMWLVFLLNPLNFNPQEIVLLQNPPLQMW